MLFGKLSPDSRKVLAVAAAESQAMNHLYIGTEHLFIGLCESDNGLILKAFERLDIDPLIRREIRARVGRGNGSAWGDEVIFTPRAYNVSKIAEQIALKHSSPNVEPIHILLAVLMAGDGVAVRLLRQKGIETDNTVRSLTEMLSGSKETETSHPAHSSTPLLDAVGRDITELARQNRIGPIIGRKQEIKKLARILTLKRKSNPLLLGEAGTGKTALVEGLALRLIRDDIPKELKGLRIIEVSLTALVAGAIFRGEFEARILRMIEEAASNRDVVLFIDEIHMLIGAGGTMDASNILKPALARGEIKCIGATTMDEYRKHFETDPALERRFQPVRVEEPTPKETIEILQGLRESYEIHHSIRITDAAIESAVRLAVRYLPDRRLPDKSIDLIDQAAARKRIRSLTITPENFREVSESEAMEVTEEDIARVVSEWTDIPVTRLTKSEAAKLAGMEEALSRRVIGQPEAINAVARCIRKARAGLSSPNRPTGVFLLAGPTGVGKTELAKALAEFLFDDERRIIRVDMSEYMEKHAVSKLIGAPPGYIGYDEGGQLTGAVRTHPYSVVLLDEIEKAHPDVMNLFLQVFDEGRLTDSKGRVIDFTNTVIFLTSNLGGHIRKNRLGFAQADGSIPERGFETDISKAISEVFRPEFLNRLDQVITFNSLGRPEIKLIIDKLLGSARISLSGKGLKLRLSDEIYDLLIKNGYSETYGAREINRAVQRLVIDPLAEEMIKDRFNPGETIVATLSSGKIAFHSQTDSPPSEKGRPDGETKFY